MKTEEEKIRACVRFVTDGLQYQTTPFRLSAYVPTEGKQVLRDRYGDCKDKSALLCAMLGTIGIEARMALVNTRDDGVLPYLPSPRFSHAIAVVTTKGGPLWIDPTATNVEYGYLPMADQGVPALIIDSATKDLVLTPEMPDERNVLSDSHACSLASNGKLTGEMTLKAIGNWGWMLRSTLKLVPTSQRDEFYRGFISDTAPNARLVSGSIEDLESPEKPLTIRVKYEVDKFASNAGNLALLRLPWGAADTGDINERLAQKDGKSYPAEISPLKGLYQSEMVFTLPAGWTPQELEPKISLTSKHAQLDATYANDAGVLRCRRTVRFGSLRIPAEDLPDFVKFLAAAAEENRRQLVFKKP